MKSNDPSGVSCLSYNFSVKALSQLLFEDLGVAQDAHLVVAYSGGCDSQVLLHSLCQLRQYSNIHITAAHFDHNLQPQSTDWQSQCKNWASALHVEFHSTVGQLDINSGRGIEASARAARYAWIDSITTSDQVILTAHHANDQAESFLLSLFQGKGIKQLGGIQPDRPLSYGSKKRLIRPLLGFTQASLQKYALEHQLQWIDDPSNQHLNFYRNFVRHEVLPRLGNGEQDWIIRLCHATEHCRNIADREQHQYQIWLDQWLAPDKRGVFCLIDPISISLLSTMDWYLFSGFLRHWIHQAGQAAPGNARMKTLFHLITEGRAHQATISLGQSEIRLFNKHLYLIRKTRKDTAESVVWDYSDRVMEHSGLRISARFSDQDMAQEHIKNRNEVKLVWRQGGEKVLMANRKQRSSLKNLLQRYQVTPWERERLPMLVINNHIAWVYRVGGAAGNVDGVGNDLISLDFSWHGD